MIYQKLPLNITDHEVAALKSRFQQAVDNLNQNGAKRIEPHLTVFDESLQAELSSALRNNAAFHEVIKKIDNSGDFYHVNFTHSDTEILNMPWGIALDPTTENRRLMDIPRLFISKSPFEFTQKMPVPAAGPLKILVMISMPENSPYSGRLDFEKEEHRIITAFLPLYQSGAIQIDYTDNGSLNALRRKIKLNDYHILHFSGHGRFVENDEKGGKKGGFLALENDMDLRFEEAGGDEFAEALLKTGHKIPLVVLSACETAKSNIDKGFASVTESLLKRGISAVVSMGASVRDDYATEFASFFYQSVSEKRPLAQAFHETQIKLLEKERKEIAEHRLKREPIQWLIPNLYVNSDADLEIVDWKKSFDALKQESADRLFVNATLTKSTSDNDIFVGRKKDIAKIMPQLNSKKPVMLTGQGGIGKTSLALKLIQRLAAYQPNLVCFVFNQEGREFDITKVYKELRIACKKHNKRDWVNDAEEDYEKEIDRINYLLEMLSKDFPVLILFDNLETFQDINTGSFKTDFESTLEIIKIITKTQNLCTILTGRYPVNELKQEIAYFDVNDISENDFLRKCSNLGFLRGKRQELELKPLITLYKTLGGNYRAVEFFHNIYTENKHKAEDIVKVLEEKGRELTEQVMRKMAENLIFSSLWSLATDSEKALAEMLCHYTIPVTDMAFCLQGITEDIHPSLVRLKNLTIIQIYRDYTNDLVYFFLPPLVKRLLEDTKVVEKKTAQFHEMAGRYHFYMLQNINENDINEAESAFWHFYHAKNKNRLNELGRGVADSYYNRYYFKEALAICMAVYEMFGRDTAFWYLNRIGLIYHNTDKDIAALKFSELALEQLDSKKELTKEDKENKGATLNNISQIYDARGDYDRALEYLQRSLKISQEIGDKHGEGVTLNNISQIFQAGGDYDRALEYLQRSLKILQEIGDKSGMIPTLHNMAMIERERENWEGFLNLEKQAYQLAMETGDAQGVFNVGWVLGKFLLDTPMREQGVQMLRQAYQVGRAAGFPRAEEVGRILRELGE
jgi:tetratricopeptide (TPR) repeat protein